MTGPGGIIGVRVPGPAFTPSAGVMVSTMMEYTSDQTIRIEGENENEWIESDIRADARTGTFLRV